MKRLIFAAAILAAPAAAQTEGERDFCHDIASFARTAAEERDRGMTHSQAIATVAQVADTQPELAALFLEIVSGTFANPDMSPDMSSGIAFSACITSF
ncbi:hypothetical protein [Cereibacter sphaeroides]|jgi:pilus assembly protein TadC|uniref:hypothetical protein n=1 Tax=Cereibacter sphaeroides TaxID=1063 RepID=UPI00006640BF|nr:hypothetical protein Rsph17029_0674 [Cereibacter sphaeroides ATCC 17029]